MSDCSNCGGSGYVSCPTCEGMGEIRNISNIPVLSDLTGIANDWQECPTCHGNKEKKCSRCHGTGRYSDD